MAYPAPQNPLGFFFGAMGIVLLVMAVLTLLSVVFIAAMFWKATLLLFVLAALAFISTVFIRGAAGIPG